MPCSVLRPTAISTLSDGKILVASGGTSSGSLARYNPNGSLDKTFGISGRAATITPLSAIVVQSSDGKIVGVGANTSRLSLTGNATGFGLVRFNTSGSIDTTFGARGGVTTAFANAPNTGAGSVRIQATNGDIVAAGTAGTSGTSASFALARYLGTGNLDLAFGSGGLVTTGFGNFSATVASMVLQGDGKIVVAGTVSGQVIEVARYLAQ